MAWTICIGFSLFVYHLTINLNEAKNELAVQQANLQQDTKIDPQLIPIENLNWSSSDDDHFNSFIPIGNL